MIQPLRLPSLTVLIAAMLAVFGMGGCGGDKSTATPESCLPTVGMACKSNSDCSGCAGGYCLSTGICTGPCSGHSDCGCPDGTVGLDIKDGKCAVSCERISNGVLGCMEVCGSSSACAGTATCLRGDGDIYNVCR
jgi:hypothetical protein